MERKSDSDLAYLLAYKLLVGWLVGWLRNVYGWVVIVGGPKIALND